MKTDVIVISNDGNNMEAVLDQVDALATYMREQLLSDSSRAAEST